MPKLIWEKKLQEAVKLQQRFGMSDSEIKGAVFVQRYYPDINKRVRAALPTRWKPNQELNELNALKNINDCMQILGFFSEVVENLYRYNSQKLI